MISDKAIALAAEAIAGVYCPVLSTKKEDEVQWISAIIKLANEIDELERKQATGYTILKEEISEVGILDFNIIPEKSIARACLSIAEVYSNNPLKYQDELKDSL